jgi:putative two-component system response regulator
MALAEVFDALASRRVYKEAMPFAAAVELIVAGAGSHFDPAVVEAFVANLDTFRNILERFADTDETLSLKLANMRARGML